MGNARTVWGISYSIKVMGRWIKHTGPCGINIMTFNSELRDILGGRPIFFRTRELARKEAKKQSAYEVKKLCRRKIEKYEISWRKTNG